MWGTKWEMVNGCRGSTGAWGLPITFQRGRPVIEPESLSLPLVAQKECPSQRLCHSSASQP